MSPPKGKEGILMENSMNNEKQNKPDRSTAHILLLDSIYVALFAAVITVCSQIQIPLGPVPFTLQTLGIFTAAGLLGTKRGTLSTVIYVLLGAVGVPVFAGFSGGIGILTGATGGYIIGFIFTALATGLMSDIFGKKLWSLAVGMVAGLLICYIFGTTWFIIVSNSSGNTMDIMTALGYCVFPFLIPDAVKIVAAVVLVNRLGKILKI